MLLQVITKIEILEALAMVGSGRRHFGGQDCLQLFGVRFLELTLVQSMRRYDLSRHAKDVISERDIQLHWLEQVLEWPEFVEPDADDPELIHHVGRIREHGNRLLRVVFNSRSNPVRIVTVYFDRKMKDRV